MMNTAAAPRIVPEIERAVLLSQASEHRLLFWTAPPEALFPPDVAAHVLDVDVTTLASWRCREQGPAFCKRGTKVYYRKQEIVTWMENRKGGAGG